MAPKTLTINVEIKLDKGIKKTICGMDKCYRFPKYRLLIGNEIDGVILCGEHAQKARKRLINK